MSGSWRRHDNVIWRRPLVRVLYETGIFPTPWGTPDLAINHEGPENTRPLAAENAKLMTREPDVVLTIDFAHGEMVLARETKPLACRIDTRESTEVGSLHEVLLDSNATY